MRWIKGDTPNHKDTGTNSFDKTYLVYLTDNSGQFIIGNDSYPITQGIGYSFSEGLYHETINTGYEPRLLLGPMSEKALSVGMYSIGDNSWIVPKYLFQLDRTINVIKYFHIELENYFTDYLVINNGIVVEA